MFTSVPPTDITTEALKRIGELYAIEAEIRGSPAEDSLAVRKAQTVPLMQSLYDWIQSQMKVLSRHPDTARAFAYLLKQWDALNLYCRNGWAEIDNNIAESVLLFCTRWSGPAGLTAWSRRHGCVTSSIISRTGR